MLTGLNTVRDYISYYQNCGLNVIPIKPKSEEPFVPWQDFTTKKFVGEFPQDCNVGVICGEISDKLIVIEIEDEELWRSFAQLQEHTMTVSTSWGTKQIWCKLDGDTPKSMNLVNNKKQKVTIYSDHSFVMAPPSVPGEGRFPYEIISLTRQIGVVKTSTVLDKMTKHGFNVVGATLKVEYDFDAGLKNVKEFFKNGGRIILPKKVKSPQKTTRKKTKSQTDDGESKSHTEIAYEIMSDYHFKTLRETEDVLYYKDGVYKYGAETIIKEEAEKRIAECTAYLANEVLKTIQRNTYVSVHEFDKDPNLLNVKNCIVNIRTGEVSEHTPNYLSRVQLGAKYHPKAVAYKFCRFIKQCLPDPKDAVTVIEEMATCLLKELHFEKAYMFVGSGSNGKSTLLETLQAVLGEDSYSNVSMSDLVFGRFARAELDGKLANIYADITSEELTRTGVLKALISGDAITVERKNRDPFKMHPFAKMFFSANELPEIHDDSDAMFRRFMITEWTQQFIGVNKDNMLKKILRDEDELSGILNIMIRTALWLEKTQKFRYEQSVDELRVEWKERADPVQNFLNNRVKYEPEPIISKNVLYAEYTKFCRERNIIPRDFRGFNTRVKSISPMHDYVGKIDGKATRCWKGGRIIRNEDEKNKVESTVNTMDDYTPDEEEDTDSDIF